MTVGHWCVVGCYVMWWLCVYVYIVATGVTLSQKMKTLCLSLAPRLPMVYCRPSSPLGTKAAFGRASGFRGAV
jgi:hypothetical protein